MKILSNERLIRRNARLGQFASLGGFAILLGGLYISFQLPEYFWVSWIALLLGFILSQVGLYFGNRWGKSPRPDEHLNAALKGLTKEYSMYHYRTPVSHLLVGPAGVWVLAPRNQEGNITYQAGRWRHKGKGAFFQLRRFFGQENLGRPDVEVGSEINSLHRYFEKNMPEVETPPIQAALVFTNPDVSLDVEEAPLPTLPVKKLKQYIREQAKENRLSTPVYKAVQSLFEPEEE